MVQMSLFIYLEKTLGHSDITVNPKSSQWHIKYKIYINIKIIIHKHI